MVSLAFKYIIIPEQQNCLIPQFTSSDKLRGKKGKIGILDYYFTQLEIKYINVCSQVCHHFNKAGTLRV